jgi:hypothetical protein
MTRPLDALSLTSRSVRDEVKAAADAIEIGAIHERFPGLNGLLNGVFDLKNRLRKRTGGARTAIEEATGDPDDLAAEPLLSYARPAIAVRLIAESVHQARIVALRRRNYLDLAARLSGVSGGNVLSPELPESAVPYVFPLYVRNPRASYQPLRAAGVPIFRWDEIWPGTPAIENDHGLHWASHVYQLGCHQDLSPEDIEGVAATVRNFVQPR